VKLLCKVLACSMHVIVHLFKPTEHTTPRAKPKVNFGVQVIKMCQSSSSTATNKPLCWGRRVNNEGAMLVWRHKALFILGKCSTIELHPQPQN
jgi:hypothetical protein